MLDFDEDDDEGEVRREFEGMEELERVQEDEEDDIEVRPGCHPRRRNRFINDEAGQSKRDANTTEVSSLSTSYHAHSLPDLFHMHPLS